MRLAVVLIAGGVTYAQSVPQQGLMAMDCTTANQSSVDHGQFYRSAVVDLGPVFTEAILQPRDAGSTYSRGTGLGGAHGWLSGNNQNGAGTINRSYVQTWSGTAAATVLSQTGEGLWPNEWGHLSDGWAPAQKCDRTSATATGCLLIYIGGLPSGGSPFTGPRRAPSDERLYVCLGDHSNFDGRIQRVRIVGDGVAYPLPYPDQAFTPEVVPTGLMYGATGSYTYATFLADYTLPFGVIPDLSDGFDGHRHPGAPSRGAAGMGAGPTWVTPIDLPYSRTAQWVSPAINVPTPTACHTSATTCDSFSRRNQLPIDGAPVLGQTEASGTAPSRAWVPLGIGSRWCILDGRAAWCGTAPGGVYVGAATSTGDQDVRATCSTDQYGDWDCGLMFRAVTAQDFWYVFTFDDPYQGAYFRTARLGYFVNGVDTWVSSSINVTGGEILRVTATGDQIVIYTCVSGTCTQRYSTTSAVNQAGVGAGLYAGSPTGAPGMSARMRWDMFQTCAAGNCN